jgi:hypothetical protein
MLPTEDLFVHVYVLIDDLVTACGGSITRSGLAGGVFRAEIIPG